MVTTFLLTTAIITACIALLSIGVFRGRGTIKTCAGSAHHPGEGCACRGTGLHDGTHGCAHPVSQRVR